MLCFPPTFFYVLCLCVFLLVLGAGTCLVHPFMKDPVGIPLAGAASHPPYCHRVPGTKAAFLGKESLGFSEDFHLPPAPFPPHTAEFEDSLSLPGPSTSRNWSFASEITHIKSLPRFARQCLTLFRLETLTPRGQQTCPARGNCLSSPLCCL